MLRADVFSRCLPKGKTFAVSDEVIGDEESRVEFGGNRFSKVAELEAMTPEERFAFWQSRAEPSASAATPAETSAPPAPATSACLTIAASGVSDQGQRQRL